jgi:DNA-binding CsgD family transcriptional regulator
MDCTAHRCEHPVQPMLETAEKATSVVQVSTDTSLPPSLPAWASSRISVELALLKEALLADARQHLARTTQLWQPTLTKIQQPLQGLLAEMTETVFPPRERVSSLGSSSAVDDIVLLFRDGATTAERDAAVRRLVARLPLYLADPAARRAVRHLAQARGVRPSALLREWLFVEGLLLASREAYARRRIRLGSQWYKHQSGRVAVIPPVELLPYQFVYWLFQETRNAVEAIVLNRDYPHRTPQALDKTTPCAEPDPGLAAWGLFLPPEARLLSEELLMHLLAVTSPREREVLSLLQRGQTDMEIARTLGIKPVTVRVFRHRLRKRLAHLLSAWRPLPENFFRHL